MSKSSAAPEVLMFQLIWVVPVMVVALYIFSSIKILSEYERGVIFRLGRVLTLPRGPGIALVFAPIDRMVRMSLRVEAMEVPAQDVITRDNVTVKVNAIVYFRVIDPTKAVIEVKNFLYATSQLAQTSLRSVLGEVDLDSLLSQRDRINERLQCVLDQHTGPWGVKVSMVEVKQVDLPEQMIRVIARQAEAERERRAKVIHAEGEYLAAEKLAMAAELIQKQPAAIQLRYLQTLVEIGSEKNTTVVFPLPIDMFANVGRVLEHFAQASTRVHSEEALRTEVITRNGAA
jgi:regulator of protease activity HflC (stomatin/prohibitin superfamily)